MEKNILYNTTLMLMCDSAFPTGGFAHSQGLEYVIGKELVYDLCSFEQWGKSLFDYSFLNSDGKACAYAWHYTTKLKRTDKIKKLQQLNTQLRAIRVGKEQRLANEQQARSLIGSAKDIFCSDNTKMSKQINELELAFTSCDTAHVEPQFSVAWGSICAVLNIPLRETCHALWTNMVKQLAYVAIRIVPLGQSDALLGARKVLEHTLVFLDDMLDNMTKKSSKQILDEEVALTSFFPSLEIACLGQANMKARYFRS